MATMTERYLTTGSRYGSDNNNSLHQDPWQQPSHWPPGYSSPSPPTSPRIDLAYIASQNNLNVLPSERHEIGDDSNWIHRDKLAQIERQELAEIGKQLGFTDRIISQRTSISAGLPMPKNTQHGEGISTQAYGAVDTQLPSAKRLRTASGSLPVDDGAGQAPVWQAQHDGSLQYTPPSARSKKPSFSKIPVSKSSPANKVQMASQTDTGTNVYLARKGSIKNARNSLERVGNQKLRKQSGSTTGSDDVEAPTQSGFPEIKPITLFNTRPTSIPTPKKRSVSEGNKLPGGGRFATAQERARNVSAPLKTISPNRPGTANGPRQPINRPEGEAPWIATMFKPDPRLPQDQQIIPTHAKRLAMQHGHIVHTIAPSDIGPQPSIETPESPTTAREMDTKDSHTGNMEEELTAQSRTSLRNRFRRDTSRSRHSQEHSASVSVDYSPESFQQEFPASNFTEKNVPGPYNVEQHNYEPLAVGKDFQNAEWPLNTGNMASGEEEEHTIATRGRKDNSEKDGMAHQNNLMAVEKPQMKETLDAMPQEASTQSIRPITTATSPVRVPDIPLVEKKEAKSCGCCIVM